MPAGKPKARPGGMANYSGNALVKQEQRKNGPTDFMARSLDNLTMYDALFNGVLGSLQKDIADGLDAAAIAKKYANLAQARIVAVALTELDNGKATTAAQDVLNRALGKATERKEIRHALAESTDEELDAIIASKTAALRGDG